MYLYTQLVYVYIYTYIKISNIPFFLTFFLTNVSFIFYFLGAVYEVFERMAYYGIQSNLVIYLTKKLHQGTVASSNNVTNWVGTIWLTPILGAYIADAHLGRYWTFICASIIYLLVCIFYLHHHV